MRFWDSSALVHLVVDPPGTSDADRWLEEDRVVVAWTLSEVEIASALRRLVREGALPESEARQAESAAAELAKRMHVISDVERAKDIARRLLRVHALRAADSLQLAAALMWSDGNAEGLVFHTFDRRLGQAASREGFTVLPEPDSK